MVWLVAEPPMRRGPVILPVFLLLLLPVTKQVFYINILWAIFKSLLEGEKYIFRYQQKGLGVSMALGIDANSNTHILQ